MHGRKKLMSKNKINYHKNLIILFEYILRAIYALSDHLVKHVRKFSARGGHNWLWTKTTTFLSPRGDLFMAEGCNNWLTQKATRFNELQIPVTTGTDGHTIDYAWDLTYQICMRELDCLENAKIELFIE